MTTEQEISRMASDLWEKFENAHGVLDTASSWRSVALMAMERGATLPTEVEWGVLYEGRGPFYELYESRSAAEHEATTVEDKHAPAHLVCRYVTEWREVSGDGW